MSRLLHDLRLHAWGHMLVLEASVLGVRGAGGQDLFCHIMRLAPQSSSGLH
jgi:hypothetical protein